MKLTIDNNDGLGSLDYTPALLRDMPLTITRRRGAWTRCYGGLDALQAGLRVPANRARVTVTDAAGAVLFSGFSQSATRSSAELVAPEGSEGKPILMATETAWLTQSEPANPLQSACMAVHALAAGDVELVFENGAENSPPDLATDVTVTGEHEAAAYVTELFRGDGTTAVFTLTHAPFRESGNGTIVSDRFDDAALNAALWTRTDSGPYLTLGSNGLRVAGGTGADGATVLQFVPSVEMGGTLVAEAVEVTLAAGSDGILLGFYDGVPSLTTCIAGVRVAGSGGAQMLSAIAGGVQQASTYPFAEGHSYTFRVRLHCPELQRVRTTYEARVDGALQTFGGGTVAAPLQVVIEVQDLGLASSTLPTVLYDGLLTTPPAQCTFAPVNSWALNGSVGGVDLLQQGSAWVVTTAADGTVVTRREGATGTGADYAMTAAGNMTFDPGRVPQPGDLVTATYRREQRAAARLIDPAADALRGQLGLPGLPSWNGRVLQPVARTSVDCAAAARALLACATATATSRSGHVSWTRGSALDADVNVGDTLAVLAQTLPVQAVTITDSNSVPEQLHYRVEFGQSRANSLSFTVGVDVAADLPVPVAVTASTAALPPSLSALQVTGATGTSLQIESGVDPVAGGGYEVRRSDANFGSADTEDLVLTSSARGFSLPRRAFRERFFVRMFDGSTPRRYSAVSSVVLTNLPLS